MPGEGEKRPPLGSSALMRTSMACPFRAMSSWLKSSASPDAMRICQATRSRPGDQLGDRVLHLEAGVHLEEVELAVLVEELDGAGVVVAAGLRDLDGGRAHGLADLVGEVGRRALLDQLLVPALGRAVALAQPQRVAVLVGQHLHLDVARPLEVALEVDLGTAEVGLGLAGRRLHGLRRLGRARRRPSCRARRRRRRP